MAKYSIKSKNLFPGVHKTPVGQSNKPKRRPEGLLSIEGVTSADS